MTNFKPTKSLQVRVADAADAEKIMLLINVSFYPAEGFFVEGDRITLAEVKQTLSKGKFLLAEEDDDLIGCVYVEPRGERAYLGLLSVDPSRQQSGVGSLLMEAGEKYCSSVDCCFMDIKMVNLREELTSFYVRRGYVMTGTSAFPAHIKTKVPCHFIDMTKSLGPAIEHVSN